MKTRKAIREKDEDEFTRADIFHLRQECDGSHCRDAPGRPSPVMGESGPARPGHHLPNHNGMGGFRAGFYTERSQAGDRSPVHQPQSRALPSSGINNDIDTMRYMEESLHSLNQGCPHGLQRD